MARSPKKADSQISAITPFLHQAIEAIQVGKIAEARKLAEHALSLDEKSPDGWHILGLVARRENHLKDAIDHIERAIGFKPDEAKFYHNLGNVYRDAGQLHKAEQAYANALRIDDKDGMTYLALGTLHYQANAFQNAVICFEKTIELAPDNHDAWYNLAASQNVLGNKEKKLTAIKRALELNPNHAIGWHLLVQSCKEHDEATVTQMQRLWDEGQDAMVVDDAVNLCFGFGKIYEDRGDYDTSFAWYSKGNRIKRQSYTYDIHQSEAKFELTAKLYDEAWVTQYENKGVEDDTPVFVVGMPRSGTSLVEQILASHSLIHGAGELMTVPRLISTCEQATSTRYPLLANVLSTQTYHNFGNSYLTEARANAGDAEYVVDKLPGNFLYLGMIHAALPHARFIHCVRDGKDNAISIFKNLFGAYTPYGYDLWEIGRMQCLHHMIMDHWKKVLPKGTILEVSYESLVNDFEGQTRRMLDFVGVEWEDSCMEFHQTKRSVNTASSDQVRRPLYDTSVGSARHFGRHLGALEAAWAAE
jgi:tetratricopeptide (TPR) repeat protein